jgi:2-keto-4-pentenoate hydratase
MNEADAAAAADLLWEHWRGGRRMTALPERLRPRTREEGYAIQAQLERRSAKPLFGWKIAATSKAGQAHIAVSGPMAGRLLAEGALESGAEVSLAGNLMQAAEAEFAFRMARDLPPRDKAYTADEAVAAAGGLHPAIEVPDSRYEDFVEAGEAQLIADDACAHLFVLGPAAPESWRGIDLAAHKATCRIAGGILREGGGANVLGDPRTALAWLANELSRLGVGLKAGQVATTGACVQPLDVKPGDEVVAEFGPLGRVSVRFRA